jgi:hypothetical protein
MMTNKRSGRIVGVLLLVQVLGMMVAFRSTMPVLTTDYLNLAAPVEGAVRLAVIMLFVGAGIGLAMSVAAFGAIREHSVGGAIWLVAAGVAWFVLQAMDNAHIMSMLSLSQRFTESAGANADLWSIVGAHARSTRGFVHYCVLLTIDVWFGLFYGALFAFRLVPRWLGALGIVAVIVHTIGISLSAFVGYPITWSLAYPFAFAYLVFGGWLVVRGFSERRVVA